MKIITDPKHLSKVCDPIDYKTSKQIANKMIMFMLSHKNIGDNSVGLACNQLGLSGRIIIVKIKNKWVRFINPIISYKSDQTIITEESCLSVPNKSVKVERSKEITLYSEKGNNDGNYGWESNYTDMDAIIIQHEIDHLNGIIITDKDEIETEKFIEDQYLLNKWKK